jgi:hypothetical protein
VLDPLSSLAAFFGSEIRRLRERQGWKQEEPAGKLGGPWPPWRASRPGALEAQATRINIWSMNLVPGLFQTADYARTVMHAGRPRDAHEVIEVDVAERIRRQSILGGPSAPMVWAVFHETAVKQPTGTVDITRAQLQRLLALSRRRNVRIRILPLTSSEHAGSDGRFTVFDFADQPSVAFAEGRGSGRLIDHTANSRKCR